jgi:hypothetical protein
MIQLKQNYYLLLQLITAFYMPKKAGQHFKFDEIS